MKPIVVSICLIFIWMAALPASGNVRVEVPEENFGPPAYSLVQPAAGPEPYFIPHTTEWGAIPFFRDTACVPPDFNLLLFNDFTPAFPDAPLRPFTCPLTVEGFAIFKNGPPPIDMAPILSQFHGTGAVSIWFVEWNELKAAADDGELTIAELLGLSSLQIGFADFYKETVQPGIHRPQGPGNGKIEINASGILLDGRLFQMHVREHGDDGVSILRHVRIEIW